MMWQLVKCLGEVQTYLRYLLTLCNFSAATAWEFSQDLGNLGINLGFREFSKQSWEFWYIQEILVIPNLQRLTSVVFIHYLTACHSAMFLLSLLLLTYRDDFLNTARQSSHSSAVKTSNGYVILHFLLAWEFFRSTWEFLEHNLGNSRKVEWQHCATCVVNVKVVVNKNKQLLRFYFVFQ